MHGALGLITTKHLTRKTADIRITLSLQAPHLDERHILGGHLPTPGPSMDSARAIDAFPDYLGMLL